MALIDSCTCATGASNTGTPNCKVLMKNITALYVFQNIADDGTQNQIDLVTDTLNESFFIDKANQSDASKRWFLIKGLKAVEYLSGDR